MDTPISLCLNRRSQRLVEHKAHEPHASLHDRREDDGIAPVAPTMLLLCLLLDLADELIDALLDQRWIYTKKVDTKQDFILHFSKHKGGMVSMTHRPYDEDFKKSIVALYQNGKTQSQLSKEYGVSLSAIGKWIRLYSEVKTVDGDIMTAKQIKDLQRRNAQLEEENLILKKAIAIFTPHSNND